MLLSMKKFFIVIVVCALVSGQLDRLHAQTTDSIMPVPMGNFEQWNDFPGDTTMLMGFLPVPLYGSYTLPEGWYVPTYSVNDTVDYSGFTLPLNFSVPVAKPWRDTVHAPQGHSALVAESFMLEDVLSPLAYSLASSFLDSSLLNEVIPSIVVNAQVDLMKILPLLERASEDVDDFSWLMDIMDTADLNDYIAGGFPLNGFEPKQLRGMFKYLDGNGSGFVDDNATVLALGTYYNSELGKRMLVGAGSKNLFQLYDTVLYEPFEMEYYTLNEYFPAEYAFVEADSMVIIALSSTNGKNRARGSKLFLDSLTLVQYDGSCGRVYDVEVDHQNQVMAMIKWHSTVVPDRWMIEYGEAGFARGRGIRAAVTDSVVALTGLTAGTTYDFYVRSECGDTATSFWGFVSFTTDTVTTHDQSIDDVSAQLVKVSPNPANGRCIVEFGALPVSQMTLYDVTGKVEESREVKGDSTVVTLPHPGVYIIALQTPQGIVYKKVVNK